MPKCPLHFSDLQRYSHLCEWSGFTKLRLCLAVDGEQGLPGRCYVAPSGCQMTIERGDRIALDFTTQALLRPSAACLFRSMATTYGFRGVGVILTGMGRAGASELLLMKEYGAFTIAQDEDSSLMFGMPKEAIALGGVTRVLPLEQIPSVLTYLAIHSRNQYKSRG